MIVVVIANENAAIVMSAGIHRVFAARIATRTPASMSVLGVSTRTRRGRKTRANTSPAARLPTPSAP